MSKIIHQCPFQRWSIYELINTEYFFWNFSASNATKLEKAGMMTEDGAGPPGEIVLVQDSSPTTQDQRSLGNRWARRWEERSLISEKKRLVEHGCLCAFKRKTARTSWKLWHPISVLADVHLFLLLASSIILLIYIFSPANSLRWWRFLF